MIPCCGALCNPQQTTNHRRLEEDVGSHQYQQRGSVWALRPPSVTGALRSAAAVATKPKKRVGLTSGEVTRNEPIAAPRAKVDSGS